MVGWCLSDLLLLRLLRLLRLLHGNSDCWGWPWGLLGLWACGLPGGCCLL